MLVINICFVFENTPKWIEWYNHWNKKKLKFLIFHSSPYTFIFHSHRHTFTEWNKKKNIITFGTWNLLDRLNENGGKTTPIRMVKLNFYVYFSWGWDLVSCLFVIFTYCCCCFFFIFPFALCLSVIFLLFVINVGVE